MSKVRKAIKITEDLCKSALCIIDRGLSIGQVGDGQVCIERAISIAAGIPEDMDVPRCVDRRLSNIKIAFNDNLPFDSPQHRAEALRRIGIAQLGTNQKSFSWAKFTKELFKFNEQFLADYLDTVPGLSRPVPAESKASIKAVTSAVNSQDELHLEYAIEVLVDRLHKVQAFEQSSIINTPTRTTDFILNLLDDCDELPLPDFDAYIEGVVQILKKLKTPGSKFLYLTEDSKKAKAKLKAFKLNRAIADSLAKVTGHPDVLEEFGYSKDDEEA